MDALDLLRNQSRTAFDELLEAIEGVSQARGWAVQGLQASEYLHTEGSILSVVMHVASLKFVNGSSGFRGLEVRWRHAVERLEEIWPDWEAAKAYLLEGQEYWLESWKDLDDIEKEIDHPSGRKWPAWRLISMSSHHDSYHAGQIQLLRSVLPDAEVPPPSEADEWRKYCQPLPSW